MCVIKCISGYCITGKKENKKDETFEDGEGPSAGKKYEEIVKEDIKLFFSRYKHVGFFFFLW